MYIRIPSALSTDDCRHLLLGDKLRGRVFGMLWELAYIGSILQPLYFRSGIIDPWFNLFIFLGLPSYFLL